MTTHPAGAALGGIAVVGAQFVKFLIRFGMQVVLARLLLPADYGLIAMVAPVLALVTLIADLGLGQAVILRQTFDDRAISSLFWLGLAVNLALAVLVMAMSPVIAWFYHEPRLISITLALAALIPIASFTIQPSAMLSRDLRFKTLAIIDVVVPFTGAAAGFVAAWAGLGYWALIVSSAVECIMLPVLIWCATSWRPSWPTFERSALSLVRVGGHITGYNLAQYITNTADNVLLAISAGPVPLGLYDKAFKTVTLSTAQIITPINRVIIPLLAKEPDPSKYAALFLSMVQLMLLAGAPGIIFVGVQANPVMRLLLGENWGGVGPITTWLCLGCLAAPIYASASWLFTSQDRSGQQLRYGAIVSAISLISFIAGIPWGAEGVAAGSGLSLFLISTPYMCYHATKSGPVSIGGLTKALAPLLTASIGLVIILYAASVSLPSTTGILLVELLLSYVWFFAVIVALPDGRKLLAVIGQFVVMLRSRRLPINQVKAARS